MRAQSRLVIAVFTGVWLFQSGPALGQTRALSEAECKAFRERLAEHARLSDGVRRALATHIARYPTLPPPAAPTARTAPDRPGSIRARIGQIADERHKLEDLRLAALVKFDFSRVSQLQRQIEALDEEKRKLELELAGLPAAPTQPTTAPVSDADRIRCEDLPALYAAAIKVRQKELGAREGQAGVVPLLTLKGQNSEQIARELATQFAAWPEAATEVGLLDIDGDGRLDGFVDVPAPDLFRLYRQRSDGTLAIDVFALPGRGTGPAYSETARRLDEATARQAGRTLTDLLGVRAAGQARALIETAEFGKAHAHFLAGNFADAARVESGAARSTEFQNFRGEAVRVLEVLAPVSGGVGIRRVMVLARPNNQELWEETLLRVRPTSFLRTDVEMVLSRETRTTTGALVGTRSTTGPISFSVDR